MGMVSSTFNNQKKGILRNGEYLKTADKLDLVCLQSFFYFSGCFFQQIR